MNWTRYKDRALMVCFIGAIASLIAVLNALSETGQVFSLKAAFFTFLFGAHVGMFLYTLTIDCLFGSRLEEKSDLRQETIRKEVEV